MDLARAFFLACAIYFLGTAAWVSWSIRKGNRDQR